MEEYATSSAVVVGAVAKAADQKPDGERNGRGGEWALLDCCALEIAGFAGPFSDSFGGVSRSFLGLAVDVLQCALRLLGLALELRFFVAGHPSEFFFHLAANIFGAAADAVVSHEVILLRFAHKLRQDIVTLSKL